MSDAGGSLSILFTAFLLLAFSIAVLSEVKRIPLSVRDGIAHPPLTLTPKAFLKKCVKRGEEIPIASEDCEHCGARQPEYVAHE